MKSYVRRICKLVLIGVYLAIAGCAVSPITAERQLSGQEGAVVLGLITNSESMFDAADSLSVVTLKRILDAGEKSSGDDTPRLVRTRALTNSTVVFSGMIAPGRYEIQEFSGASGNSRFTFPINSMLGTFKVSTGEISLLGTVLIQQQEHGRFNVGYVPPESEMTELYEQLFPALAKQTRGKQFQSFELSPMLQARKSLAVSMKQMAVPSRDIFQNSKGDFYLGGKLGKAKWRLAAERRWRDLDVGTWLEVISLREYRGGLLAAGELGLLRYSSDQGKNWVQLTAPDKGLIFAAEPLPNGKVVAIVKRDAEWSAYVSDDLIVGAWRKLGSFADERSINFPWQRSAKVVMGSKVGLMLPTGTLHVVDSDSGKMERFSSGLSLIKLDAMPDGTLIVQGAGLSRTAMMSTTNGSTWADLNSSRFTSDIAFKDRKTAYAVTPISPGVFPGPFGLMTSRDGGQTWNQTGNPPGNQPYGLQKLMVDRANGTLLALMLNGDILRSTDEGKNWSKESFNLAAPSK